MSIRLDGIVKSRHFRENGNPENSNYLKILDSGWSLPRTAIRGWNDEKTRIATSYETIKLQLQKARSIKGKARRPAAPGLHVIVALSYD